jgi:hypothetical protein
MQDYHQEAEMEGLFQYLEALVSLAVPQAAL